MRNHPTTVRMREHVETLRGKPQHVRENIALLVSGGITLVVFLGWSAALLNSNTFALSGPSSEEATEIESPLTKAKETKESFNSLLGAAGASGRGDQAQEPAITIVDGKAPSASDERENLNDTKETVIHF